MKIIGLITYQAWVEAEIPDDLIIDEDGVYKIHSKAAKQAAADAIDTALPDDIAQLVRDRLEWAGTSFYLPNPDGGLLDDEGNTYEDWFDID